MKVLLIGALIALSLTTNAQTNGKYVSLAHQSNQVNNFSSTNLPTNQFSLRVKDEKHWKKLRTTGIILTSFGTACIAGGIYFITEDRRRNGAGSEGFGVAIGSAGILGGVTALGGGIAMLTIGNRHLKKLKNASISTSLTGFGLALHF